MNRACAAALLIAIYALSPESAAGKKPKDPGISLAKGCVEVNNLRVSKPLFATVPVASAIVENNCDASVYVSFRFGLYDRKDVQYRDDSAHSTMAPHTKWRLYSDLGYANDYVFHHARIISFDVFQTR